MSFQLILMRFYPTKWNFSQLLIPLLLLLLPQLVSAKIFRNAYISFELPDRWQCKPEGTEWVCSSTFKKSLREAIIILTAKEASPNDNLDSFAHHLKQSRLMATRSGSPKRSKVLHVKNRRIDSQIWVDGMHSGSEIPNYFTRYLMTVKDRIVVAVTFSAHVQHSTKYSSDFFRAIQSLKVVASQSLARKKPSLAPVNSSPEVFGTHTADIPFGIDDDLPEEEDSPSSGAGSQALGGLLLLLSGGLYIYFKKKKA